MSRVTLLCETSSPILKRRGKVVPCTPSPDRQTGERILDTLRISAYIPWVQPSQQAQRSQKQINEIQRKKEKENLNGGPQRDDISGIPQSVLLSSF